MAGLAAKERGGEKFGVCEDVAGEDRGRARRCCLAEKGMKWNRGVAKKRGSRNPCGAGVGVCSGSSGGAVVLQRRHDEACPYKRIGYDQVGN